MAKKKTQAPKRRNIIAIVMNERHSNGGSAGIHADQNRRRYSRRGKDAQKRKQELRKGEW